MGMEPGKERDSVGEISDYSTNIHSTWKDGAENCDFAIEQSMSYTEDEDHMENMPRKQNNNELSELEQQVEDAEVRCDSLMQQLEYMRMLYQDKFDQSQTEPEKASDNEEKLISPRSDTSQTKMDSLGLIKSLNEVFHKDMSDTETSSSPASDLTCLYPTTTRNEFAKEFNNTCLSPETMSQVKRDNNVENDYCIFTEVNMEPLDTCFQRNVFNAVSEDNISLIPNQPESHLHSLMTNVLDNSDNSATDISEKLVHSNTNICDVIDSMNDVTSNKGVINPVKAIKGILNGITDSVSIISQLSVHASESGKKEHSRKHHSHRQNASSHTSEKPVLQSIKSSHVLHSLNEEKNSEDINEENMKNSVLRETAYSESKYSVQQKNHKHHHHHHHHSCSRCHHHSHHSSSMSCKGRITTSDQIPIQTNPDHSMEVIFETCHTKQRNRSREHRSKREPRNHSKQGKEAQRQKSSLDAKKYTVQEKLRKQFTVVAAEQIAINMGKTPHCHNQGSKRLKNNREDIFPDVTPEKKKQRKVKIMRPLTPVEDRAEDIQLANVNSKHTAISLYKNESLKPRLSVENLKKPCEVVSVHSTSKNNQKNVNIVKTEGNKQISYIKIEKLSDNTPPADRSVTKHTNDSCSFLHTTHESSPNFATPTLSSKLKQVEKPLLQLLNFRNIPFVVGTSTTRSHNLALNLQQALSIIKLRNPSHGSGGDFNAEVASSVLGHQTRPSTSASSVGHKSFCPVAVAQMNSSKSQTLEENKISDYAVHDVNEKILVSDGDFNPGTFNSLLKSHTETENIEGLSFPHIVKKENVWDVEQLDDTTKSFQMRLRCTCFPTRACTDYQKLLCEYLSNGKDTQFVQMLLPFSDKRDIHSGQIPSRSRSRISELLQQQPKFNFMKEDVDFGAEGGTNPVYGQIQAHSKELKEVLMNMHRDFMLMNERYEYLQNEVQCSGVNTAEAIKELEKIESDLEAKEEDILIVIGIHKELTSLKQQVKALRTKTSSQSVTTKSLASQNVLPREPTVSIRLTRLLRTIQKFQEKLLHE